MEWNKEVEEQIRLLIIGHLQGTNTGEETERLQAWLDADDANRKFFNELKAAWVLSGKVTGHLRPDREGLWRGISTGIHREERTSIPERLRDLRGYRILGIAATWLILFMLGYAVSKLVGGSGGRMMQAEKTVITAPLGSKSKVELPDGSTVWLNAGSVLEYSRGFNTVDREVRLSGEGYFRVETNRKKPFVVKVFEISVIAYGTTFNVNAYPEEKKVVTTLVEGEVRIEGRDRDEKAFVVIMEPKQKVTCYMEGTGSEVRTEAIGESQERGEKTGEVMAPATRQQPVVKDQNVKTELYTSWKDSRWIIEGERFGDLVKMIERRYNVRIILESDELLNYRFSGIIEKETLEQLLGILRLTIPMQYTMDIGTVYLSFDKKLGKDYGPAYDHL